MRVPSAMIATGVALGLLAACDTSAPYSNIVDTTGRGVGFSDYAQYLRAQEELSRIRRAEGTQSGGIEVPRGAPRYEDAQASPQARADSSSIGQEAVAAVRGSQQRSEPGGASDTDGWDTVTQMTEQRSDVGAPLSAIGGEGGSQGGSGNGSDEVDVSDQQFTPQPFGTPQQNQLVERDFVPQVRVTDAELGSGDTPNLFVYALSTQHNVGQERYRRSHPLRHRRHQAACAEFPTQDHAQEAFLAAGGPEQDPNHLDPNGDGFACSWDPAPFRQAARTVRARE